MIKHEETVKSPFSFGTLLLSALKGTVWAYIFLIITFGILSAVYTYTSLPDSLVGTIVSVLTAMSLVFGGLFSSRNAHSFGWMHGALTGFFYTVIRIASGFAVFKSYVPDSSVASMFLLGILLSALGGIIGINLSKNK